MAETSYLDTATASLGQASASLASAMKSAGVAATDEDLPTAARGPFREAVRAVEYAIKKLGETSAIVADARMLEAKHADQNQE